MGNDIVDLKTAEAMGKIKDTRFMQRVLNSDEQRVVLKSDHPEVFLWAFWAAKETAYKAVSKSYPDVASMPRRYAVMLDSENSANTVSGIVNTPHGVVPVRIFFHEDHIHCIGSDNCPDGLDHILHGFGTIDSDKEGSPYSLSVRESLAVRRIAKQHIALHLGLHADDIHIMRNTSDRGPEPPMVYCDNINQNMDISLSHDGRFVAYAFLVQ